MATLVPVLLPLLLIVGAVILVHRLVPLDGKPLAAAVWYLFTPALVFHSMANAELAAGDVPKMVLVTAACSTVVVGAGWLVARATSWDDGERRSTLLCLLLPNHGNMGLPLCLFAFGDAGLAAAVVQFVIGAFLTATAGVVVVSRDGLQAGLTRVLRTPMVYAAVAGLAVNELGVTMPTAVMRAVELTGDAAVPVMLTILGLQLAGIGGQSGAEDRPNVPAMATISIGRLLVAPAVAWVVCAAIDLDGVTASVVVLQAAMPTAVITTVLTTEHDAAPKLASWAVAVTTALSLVSLAGWLTFLAG